MGNEPTVSTKKRIKIILFAAILCLLALVGRLGYLQIIAASDLREKAEAQWVRSIPVESKRGTIYDRKMKELAVSASVETVIARPKEITDPEKVALQLAPILDMTEEKILETITKNKSEVYVKRRVEKETADQIRELELKGIHFTEETKRYYPHNTLASQLLGFVGTDQAWSGIELQYDKYLTGYAGKIVRETDTRGKALPFSEETYYEPQEGLNAVLTVDSMMQHILENGITRAMEEHNTTSCTAIAMNPKTGEILAVGSKPDYDPNDYASYDEKYWKNKAISDIYEPGSTFKSIVMATAVEEHAAEKTTSFYDPGYTVVAKQKISCWKSGGHGTQNLEEILQNSCNPGFVALGNMIGKETLNQYIRAFGFGQKTGVDFPGEASGMLYSDSQLGPVEFATQCFGQGISCTPLQMINAFCAVINGGNLMQPYLVKELVDDDGNVVRSTEPKVVRQVISEETSATMRDMLFKVVDKGTGSRAKIEGYKVGGKTGTSEKYRDGKYVASFIGFAPVDNPQIALLVILDEPKEYSYTGGVVAGPVFQAIMSEMLNYLQMGPSEGGSANIAEIQDVPDVTGLSMEEAVAILQNKGFKTELEGEGNFVINQSPKPTVELQTGSKVTLYLGTETSDGEATVSVPNVKGKTIKEAGEWLESIGLKIEISGSGKAVSQEPEAGAKVAVGTTVKVIFASE